jgi:D-3-phosphoglycerate dehydrogenase
MMLALARDIPQANTSTHAGKWEKTRFMGIEVTGKTVGVIGCGNIGSIFADRAIGLRMKVIGFDPYLTPERATELGIEKVELDILFARADFITLHTPITEETKNIINAKNINKMKYGVRLINCARGGLVVEKDLKAGLEAGQIASAALDVLSTEPALDNILFNMDNVVLTPHLGASTTEAQEKVAEQVAEQMADYLLTGAVTNALNMPSVSAEEASRLSPYMKLAKQLGSFAGQATQTAYKQITIEYEGAVAELNIKPLTAAVMQGLLAPLMEGVNMVSALVIAKERGIAISEVTRELGSAYHTLIKLTVKTENQTRSVSGTLFNGSEPRLVEVKGISIDASIGPNMLYITNHDKPGFIGNLGTVLGDSGVNIATFSLGRASEGGDAIALIEIDGEPGKAVIDKVCQLEHVVMVKVMKF